MIKTTNKVSYDKVDLDKKETIYAQITSVVRNDINETYTLHIKEWYELEYTEIVPIFDEDGKDIGTEEQTFVKKITDRIHQRTMSFADADNLTDYLDSTFEISERGTARRKRYTELGHLIINNQENVRNTSWIPVENIQLKK